MRHLAEEEIQALLDGRPGGIDTALLRHLDSCRQCRDVLTDYKALYHELSDGTAFDMPRDLARSVRSRLGLEPAGRGLRVPPELVLVATAIAVMLIGISVFGDLHPVLDAVSASGGLLIDYITPHLESTHSRLAGTGNMPTIALVGIFILAFVWGLDLAFRRRHLSATRRQML